MSEDTDGGQTELTAEEIQQLRETINSHNSADPDQLRPSWEDLNEQERHAGLTYLRRRLRAQGSPTWVRAPDATVYGVTIEGELLAVLARASPLYGVCLTIENGDATGTNRYRVEWWGSDT